MINWILNKKPKAQIPKRQLRLSVKEINEFIADFGINVMPIEYGDNPNRVLFELIINVAEQSIKKDKNE